MSFKQVAGPLEADAEALAALSEAHSIKGVVAKIVVIDGMVSDQLSSTEGLPHQAFVGSLREAPLDLMADHLVSPSLSVSMVTFCSENCSAKISVHCEYQVDTHCSTQQAYEKVCSPLSGLTLLLLPRRDGSPAHGGAPSHS